MKKLISILLCVLLLLALNSCFGSKNDSVITVGVMGEIKSYDPLEATSDTEKILSVNCFEGLLRFDSNGKVDLAGATGYTIGKDTLVYTFTLNPEAEYHLSDKTEATLKALKLENFSKKITADDYVFGTQRYMKLNTSFGENIKSVKATDDYTVEFILNKTDPDFLYKLAACPVYPCDEAFFNSCEGIYATTDATVLTNGPYYIESSDITETVMERNKEYKGNVQIMNKQVVLYTTGVSEKMTQRYSEGVYDIYVDSQNTTAVDCSSSFSAMDKTWGFSFNLKSENCKELSVRKALLSSVDYERLTVPSFAESKALNIIPGGFIIGDKKYSDYKPEASVYEKNDEAAETELRGYLQRSNKESVSIKFYVPEGFEASADIILRKWNNLFGVKLQVELVVFKLSQVDAVLNEGKYDLAILPVDSRIKTPLGVIDAFRGAPCFFESEKIEKLKGELTSVSVDNALIYQNAEALIVEEAVFVPLFYTGKTLYLNEGVKGIYIANGGENIYFHSGVKTELK